MDMTQHRIALPILSGGLRSCMEYFYCCNNNRQEEEGGGFPLGQDEVQGCFDGRSEEAKGKTISEVPMRTVGDIF